jgi:membrane associated rhomboid family serine protease
VIIVSIMSLLALNEPIESVRLFAYHPTDPFRSGGITLISCFFLHAGTLSHLLPNMYFLSIFGDNVEMDLSPAGIIGLLFGGHITGMLLHSLLSADTSRPVVGASAGISAVIVYYALTFPKAKLSLLILFRWFKLSAMGALILWGLLQGIGAIAQATLGSPVSYLAHVGGGAVGAFIWYFKQRGLQSWLEKDELSRNSRKRL